MCQIQIDCNNTIIEMLIWPDSYEKIEAISELKNRNIVISGVIKNDKFRNKKILHSNMRTKLYIIG